MPVRWQLRPGRWEDLPREIEIIRGKDLHFRGRSDVDLEVTRERMAADPDFDLGRDVIVAWAEADAVGAAIINPSALNLAVHPDREEPGLRAALLDWGEAQLTTRGRALRVGLPAAEAPTVPLLRARGYRLERFYAEMARDFTTTGPPDPAVPPAGYSVRAVDLRADAAVLHALDEAAFSPRPDYQPETLEAFDARHLSFSAFAPEWSRIAHAHDGAPAGSVIGSRRPGNPGGYIALLAVHPDHTGRGLGRSLLLGAFGGVHAAGLPEVSLHVASDNPRALTLYTSVGMTEAERMEHYLRPRSAG